MAVADMARPQATRLLGICNGSVTGFEFIIGSCSALKGRNNSPADSCLSIIPSSAVAKHRGAPIKGTFANICQKTSEAACRQSADELTILFRSFQSHLWSATTSRSVHKAPLPVGGETRLGGQTPCGLVSERVPRHAAGDSIKPAAPSVTTQLARQQCQQTRSSINRGVVTDRRPSVSRSDSNRSGVENSLCRLFLLSRLPPHAMTSQVHPQRLIVAGECVKYKLSIFRTLLMCKLG